MIFEHANYRSFLKAILAERIRKNPGQSMRALAQHLGFAASTLSEAMSGKANLSLAAARKIAARMKLSARETDYLCLLVQLEADPDPEVRELTLERLRHLRPAKRAISDLSLDQFRQISDWYHSAILEMVYLDGFDATPDEIARALSISKPEVELAIERLLRLGLLDRDEQGRLIRTETDLFVQSEVKTAAMRKFYRQMLEKASEALEEQTPQERKSAFLTLALDPAALPEIERACDKFFEEIGAISQRYPKKTSVYHFGTHCFNLTKTKE